MGGMQTCLSCFPFKYSPLPVLVLFKQVYSLALHKIKSHHNLWLHYLDGISLGSVVFIRGIGGLCPHLPTCRATPPWNLQQYGPILARLLAIYDGSTTRVYMGLVFKQFLTLGIFHSFKIWSASHLLLLDGLF